MAETPRDIRIAVQHIQGYGGPDAWKVSAVDWRSNRLLEAATAHSAREAGRLEARMEDRWKANYTPQEWQDRIALAGMASPWCSRCAGHTLEGQTRIGERVFCETCVAAGAVEEERRRIVAAKEDAERRTRQQSADKAREYEAAALEAQAGFHWRDGWFARRLDDGAVRLCKVAPAPRHLGIQKWITEDLRIPPNEWASIVASVSVRGEDGDTWRAALAFHLVRLPAPGELDDGPLFDDATLNAMCGSALRLADDLSPGPAASTIRRLVQHLRRERQHAGPRSRPAESAGGQKP